MLFLYITLIKFYVYKILEKTIQKSKLFNSLIYFMAKSSSIVIEIGLGIGWVTVH